MGMPLTLVAADSHKLGAYRADPAGKPKGGVVVIQEIFGVNHHIRAVCDRVAEAGLRGAGAGPVRPHRARLPVRLHAGRDRQGAQVRRGARLGRDAARHRCGDQELRSAGPTAIMGFCMGGTISFLAACRLSGLSAAVCYYGGGIARFADEKPKCPTQMHFGEKDAHIPMSAVDDIRKKRPDCEVHVYQGADHGFHCDERGSYHAESAKIAWGRAMTFLEKHMKA